MRAEVGELGLEALRAVKERLDPAGIMNPGKLLPQPSAYWAGWLALAARVRATPPAGRRPAVGVGAAWHACWP